MTPRAGRAKKWAMGAAIVGGVATGVVTAAGASITSGPSASNPIAAEAGKLHEQILALSSKEESLKSALRSRRVETTATTSSVAGPSSVDGVKPPAAAVVSVQHAPSSTTAPTVVEPDRGSGTRPAKSEGTLPSTTEVPVSDAPPTTEAPTTTTSVPSGDGDQSAGGHGDD